MPRDGIEPPTRGFSKQPENPSFVEEKATFSEPRRGFGEVSDPDEALKMAIKAAVDAGQYERAAKLLEVLKITPSLAPVIALRR